MLLLSCRALTLNRPHRCCSRGIPLSAAFPVCAYRLFQLLPEYRLSPFPAHSRSGIWLFQTLSGPAATPALFCGAEVPLRLWGLRSAHSARSCQTRSALPFCRLRRSPWRGFSLENNPPARIALDCLCRSRFPFRPDPASLSCKRPASFRHPCGCSRPAHPATEIPSVGCTRVSLRFARLASSFPLSASRKTRSSPYRQSSPCARSGSSSPPCRRPTERLRRVGSLAGRRDHP